MVGVMVPMAMLRNLVALSEHQKPVLVTKKHPILPLLLSQLVPQHLQLVLLVSGKTVVGV